jgi:hypothetical protein
MAGHGGAYCVGQLVLVQFRAHARHLVEDGACHRAESMTGHDVAFGPHGDMAARIALSLIGRSEVRAHGKAYIHDPVSGRRWPRIEATWRENGRM